MSIAHRSGRSLVLVCGRAALVLAALTLLALGPAAYYDWGRSEAGFGALVQRFTSSGAEPRASQHGNGDACALAVAHARLAACAHG